MKLIEIYLNSIPFTSANVGLSLVLKTYGMITDSNIGRSLSLFVLGVLRYVTKSEKFSWTADDL